MSQNVYAEPRTFRKEAEQHWNFIEKLLNANTEPGLTIAHIPIETTHFLYVEAMVHGYKHAVNEQSAINENHSTKEVKQNV